MSFLVETNAGTRSGFPAQAGIASPPATVVAPTGGSPLPNQQLLSPFTTNVSVQIPALTANIVSTVAFAVPLSTFPTPFKVLPGTTAIIQASLALSGPPSTNTTVQAPTLNLSVAAASSFVAGSGNWTLVPGTYQNLVLNCSVGVLTNSTGIAAQSLTFVCHAQLLGSPSVIPPTPTLTPATTVTNGTAPAVTGFTQVTRLTLVAGTVSWTYPVPYISAPVLVATAEGAPSATPAELYINSKTNVAATINSTLVTDTRVIDVVVIGNPT